MLVIAAVVAGFFSVRGAMPFMPVFGTSMEPELKAGDLILIKEIDPDEIEIGTIIVYRVPAAIRDFYNYPAIVSHRVTEIRDLGELGKGYRTKGDNTGGDPFTVRSSDLLGVASSRIPYLGFVLLFFQSDQGLMFLIISVILFALFLYVDEINRGRMTLQRGIFAPVIEANRHLIEESRHGTEMVAERVLGSEKKMDSVEQTLVKFASAIEQYAEHLKSHTSAIQGLSSASQDLAKTTANQEKLLDHLYQSMAERPVAPSREKVLPEVAPRFAHRMPETIERPRRMRLTPTPVVPARRPRVASHPPEIMSHTSPMRFAGEVREEMAPLAQRQTLPESEKVATAPPARPSRKEAAIPGCWRSQRRLGGNGTDKASPGN